MKSEQADRENEKRLAEEARKARDAEKVARKQAERAAKEISKQKAEERKYSDDERLEKLHAEHLDREQARQQAEEVRKVVEAKRAVHYINSELYKGDVQLVIKSSSGYEPVNQFMKDLRSVQNLKIVLNKWSESKGVIELSQRNNTTLGGIFNKIPALEQIYKKGRNVVVVLKSNEKR